MKKSFAVFGMVCMLISGLIGQSNAAEKVIIGVSIPTADHGWTGGIVWWAEKAIKEYQAKYSDVEFIYKTSDSDKKQVADVEAMLQQKINALVILPHKPAPLISVLNRFNKSGGKIIIIDRSIPKVPKSVYLAGDNYQFGRKSGEYMTELVGGTANLLIMEGIPCEGNTLRVNGFKDAIDSHPGMVVMDSQPAYWNPTKGYELMQQYLKNFAHIDAIWAGDDDVLVEVLKAYKESGRTDVKYFLGGGGSKTIIKMILDKDPLVKGTVIYPPSLAYDGIRMAVESLKEDKPLPKEVTIPSELITLQNAKSHYYPDSVY